MHCGSLRFSEADKQYVTACLGQAPKGVIAVAARDREGRPTVITNLPLQGADAPRPFPTLYWLIDPRLSRRIADLERQGGVRAVEAAIHSDPQRLTQHCGDNAQYAKTRWAVLNDEEERRAQASGFIDVLKRSGVGGVADHGTIKCLHAQYAYHLARQEAGTTAGRLMRQMYDMDAGV